MKHRVVLNLTRTAAHQVELEFPLYLAWPNATDSWFYKFERPDRAVEIHECHGARGEGCRWFELSIVEEPALVGRFAHELVGGIDPLQAQPLFAGALDRLQAYLDEVEVRIG